jgi:membrane-bound metal-dependent hydrolase YbcI (DUF457 family)
VDPVSHLLFGRTVALTIRRRPEMHGLTSALVLGSILPDIDILLVPRGFDWYLRAHAAGTHSLVGSIIEAGLLALFLRVVVRGSRLPTLLAASWVGAAGHIFTDLAAGSDIRVLEPFSRAVVGWHLVAMGDVMVLSTLAAAVLCAWRWPPRAPPIAAAALCVLALLLGVKAASQARALARYHEAVIADPPIAVEVEPDVFHPFEWTIYDRIGERVRAWRVHGRAGTVSLAFERLDARGASLAALSLELPVVRRFVALSRIPFARLEREGERRLVFWSDARWCSSERCDVSFGGTFDAGDVPLDQLIQIGDFRQTRPPSVD